MLGEKQAAERDAINLARVSPFWLGPLKVLPATRQLARDGRSETLEPRVMQVLVALAEARGAVVSRGDLIARCWDGRIVGDNAIHRALSRLRDVASGIGEGCFRLETVSKVGYRLIALHATAPESSIAAPVEPALPPVERRNAYKPFLVGAALLMLAVIVALVAFTRSPASDLTTIAVTGEHGRAASEFADGLAGELTHLAAARPNTLAFAEGPADAHADYRLAVALQSHGSIGQADVSLFRTGAADLLWSTTVSAPKGDQPLLRERVANAVFRLVGCALKTNNDGSRSDDQTLRLAFSACERLDDFESGMQIEMWRRVVARNQENARAIATLALKEANWAEEAPQLAYMTGPEQSRLRQTARRDLLHARALQPSLGLTYAAEAALLPKNRWAQRLSLLDRGVAADPEIAELHTLKVNVFQDTGRTDDARDEAVAAAELEPSSSACAANLALALAYAGYIGAGATKLSSAERIWPASQAVREARLSFDFRYGDAKRLLAQVDKGALLEPYSSRTSQKGWMHAYLLARADPTPANIDVAVKAISAFLNPLSALPSIVHLGRIDAAYDYVNRPAVIAWLLRGDTYVLFRVHMRPFLFDRRFMAFADRIGLLRYWQTSGHWPDFCRDKELPYDCQAEARRLHLAKAV